MPGAATATRQERFKKAGARPTPPGLFTINEEDEQQRRPRVPDLPCRTGGRDSEQWKTAECHQAKPHERRSASLGRLAPAALGQSNNNSGSKPDLQLALRVDDRQRLARERRVEREKQLAARESFWLEKEEKARQHYEKHLEERKKKLEEQRIKEERRRAAVEEKRKQRLDEDKERHEAVVRRTMERSQKPRQRPNRWSWGGPLHSSTSINSSDPERRSISTMNLSKHVDPVISKRLSASSATLLNAPDRARRLQLSPWESSIVNRLLTPTHSFLARSKSTAALSGDSVMPICPRSASCSPISPQPYKARSGERPKLVVMASENAGRRRTTHSVMTDKKEKGRENERETSLLNPSFSIKRSPSPSIPKARSPAPSPVGFPQKTPTLIPGNPKQTISPPSPSKILPASQRPPSPGNVRPIKKDARDIDRLSTENESGKETLENTERKEPLTCSEEPATEQKCSEKTEPAQEEAPVLPSPLPPALLPSPTSSKMSAGTNNPEEATRILTEKRRLAREQREREEQEKREREEADRQKMEEIEQRKAEERARRDKEARRLEAERKQKEEEERRQKEEQLLRLAEEKEQREKDEAARFQKQKEEEEARLREDAERIRIEREKHFQREEQERLGRKKRLEEIMKRTRRSEATDKQSNAQRNGDISRASHETATQPVESEQGSRLQYATESPRNGDSPSPSEMPISHQLTATVDSVHEAEKRPNENGLSMQKADFEEIITLPTATKPSKVNSFSSDGSNIPNNPFSPILAFEETENLGSLAQVDSVQTQQTAEVI